MQSVGCEFQELAPSKQPDECVVPKEVLQGKEHTRGVKRDRPVEKIVRPFQVFADRVSRRSYCGYARSWIWTSENLPY